LEIEETITIMRALNFELIHPLMLCIMLNFDKNIFGHGINFKNLVEKVFQLRNEDTQRKELRKLFSIFYEIEFDSKQISLEKIQTKYNLIQEEKKPDFKVLSNFISANKEKENVELEELISIFV